MNKQYNTGSGPGVPIISSVPRIPTPQYTMNIVNGIEIVAHPAKGTNNLNQVNNNTSNRPVYLDNGEKIQEESITHDFNKDNNSLDHLTRALTEGATTIHDIFTDEEGYARADICGKYVEVAEELVEYLKVVAREGQKYNAKGRELNVIPSVIQTVTRAPSNGALITSWVKDLSREELESYALKWEAAEACASEMIDQRDVQMRENKRLNEEITRCHLYITELEERVSVTVRHVPPVNVPPVNVTKVRERIPSVAIVPDVTNVRERIPSAVPSVVQNVKPNGIPSNYEAEMRRALGGGMVMNITRPCDYCSEYTYLQEIGGECTMCERYKDMDYCRKECGFCQSNKKSYNNANNRVVTSRYVQVIKRKKVEEMLAIQPIVTAEPKVREAVVIRTKFNRNGNFVDKFLAVTYTLDDGDMTRDNIRYLVRQLEDNFMKLTQISDMECKGYIYVIEYTKALVPHLHGLVRMSTEKIVKSISASDTRFTGKNKIITKRPGDNGNREEKVKMLLRPINVEGWIAYMEKNYVIVGRTEIQGNMERIKEGWDYKEAPPMYPF